jgi:hypothetical protein
LQPLSACKSASMEISDKRESDQPAWILCNRVRRRSMNGTHSAPNAALPSAPLPRLIHFGHSGGRFCASKGDGRSAQTGRCSRRLDNVSSRHARWFGPCRRGSVDRTWQRIVALPLHLGRSSLRFLQRHYAFQSDAKLFCGRCSPKNAMLIRLLPAPFPRRPPGSPTQIRRLF